MPDETAPAHRITWFGVERPVEGTVFVKPPQPWSVEDVPEEAVAAVFAALDPNRETYNRDADEVAEVRIALAAAAPHLIAAHQKRS